MGLDHPILSAALAYVARGSWIFPAPPDAKKSYKCADHSNGRKWGMTRDPAEVRRDFTRWKDARIGLPTGAVNGLIVIETDTKAGGHDHDGEPSLLELEAKHGKLPETRKAASPSGSVHRFFKHPGADIKIKCSASELGLGIDVRGDGGMVIAPPSVNKDGRAYRWLNGFAVAPMPEWLIALTREKPRTISERAVAAIKQSREAYLSSITGDEYGQAALASEIDALIATPAGRRNHRLNRASFCLFQLVAGGELDGAEVWDALIGAATANGLVDDDGIKAVNATINSGQRAGLQLPRSRGDRS